jgi:hypothetical protein
MRFIITAQACADNEEPDAGGDLDEALLTAYMRFNEEMHKAGVLVASEGLNPAAPGARIAVSKGKRYIVDGPFAESKELVDRLRRRFPGHCARHPVSARTMYWRCANSPVRTMSRQMSSPSSGQRHRPGASRFGRRGVKATYGTAELPSSRALEPTSAGEPPSAAQCQRRATAFRQPYPGRTTVSFRSAALHSA